MPEGEGKTDLIIKKGGVATTSPFGAGRNKWHSEYSEALSGAKVIVLPDNDKPGHDFAREKARSLCGKVASVKVLELPDLPEKGDVVDWFDAGHTLEELEELAAQCPEYEPPTEAAGTAAKSARLEDAVLALTGVCDRASTRDGQGLNKFDSELFHSLADSIQRGRSIAVEIRPKIKRRIAKYANQLAAFGININDTLTAEERSDHDDGDDDKVRGALIPRLANAILSDSNFAQDQGGKLYRYHDGAYQTRGASFIGIQVKALLDSWGEIDSWSSRLAAEVIEFIRVDAPVLWERPPLDTLNVRNGLLNVDTLELSPHSPEFLSCVQIPVVYDPAATCPAWDTFADDVFPEDGVPLAYEIPAWLMLPEIAIQKAILLIGEAGNGKSTYCEAVRGFIGRDNTCSLSLQKMESDRFAVARLVGKLANICPDLPSEHLVGTSTFKTVTGGDTATAEYKFRDSFDFVPYARLVFSANHCPRSSDASQAFFDRWLVVPFNNRFRGAKGEIPRSMLDAQLADPYELSGVLNKALLALKQIRTRHGFSESDSMKATWNELRATTDPLAVWLAEATVDDPYAMVPKKDLKSAYNKEADRRGHPPMTSTAFGLALRRLHPNLQEAQRTIANKVVWVWLGIGLKTDATGEGGGHSYGSRGSRGFLYINRAENKISSCKDRGMKNIEPVKQSRENRVNPVDTVKLPAPPTSPCPCCGGTDFWLRESGSGERQHGYAHTATPGQKDVVNNKDRGVSIIGER